MATTQPSAARPLLRLLRTAIALALAGLAAMPQAALAQTTITPFVRSTLTWSDNASLLPKPLETSDFILSIVPGIEFVHRGPRSRVDGTIAARSVVYTNGTSDDRIEPEINLTGEIELVPDRFFLEANATLTETFYSPFGPQPDGVLPSTRNRVETQWYRITPRLQGDIGSSIDYRVTNDSLWTNQDGEEFAIDSTFTNRFRANIDRRPEPFGWGADAERTDYKISGRDNQERSLARGRALWAVSPQLIVNGSAGYEVNRFIFGDRDGSIYGAGVRWAPTERTALSADWEHRFFGASYDVEFDHRTPLTLWSVSASRNLSSYPESLADLPAGTFVPGLLNELFRARIPDPADRISFVSQFMEDRGLPIFLNNAVNLYNEQIYLQERARAALALLGVRNTVLFVLFRLKTEPIEGTPGALPALQTLQLNNTQIGFDTSWAYRLAARTTSTLSLDIRRTEADAEIEGKSDQAIVRWTLTHTISPKTSVFGGLRWQRYRTDIAGLFDYDESAIFAGFNYAFR